MEIRSNFIAYAICRPRVRVEDQSRFPCTPPNNPVLGSNFALLSHTFHNFRTVIGSQDHAENWKTCPKLLFIRLIAR